MTESTFFRHGIIIDIQYQIAHLEEKHSSEYPADNHSDVNFSVSGSLAEREISLQRMETVNTVIAASIINAFESFTLFFLFNGLAGDPAQVYRDRIHWSL